MKKIIAVIMLAALISACSGNIQDKDISISTAAATTSRYDDIYSIYLESMVCPAKYEPKNGCISGAYILSDKSIGFNMEEFENKTGKKHMSYIYHLKLGEDFPTNWILECLSGSRLPYIIIQPPQGINPIQPELLKECAQQAGSLKIPMLIGFYPNPSKIDITPAEYKNFFKTAYNEFRNNAPDTAFVWQTAENDVYESEDYFPGNEYIDWVGLEVYEKIKDKTLTKANENISYFCQKYQSDFPILLTIGISHYSSNGHRYYNDEALLEIKRLYDSVINDYPRIKAVYYMDFNAIELGGEQNYTLTDNDQILSCYAAAIKDSHFINYYKLYTESSEASNIAIPLAKKLSFTAYKKGSDFFIDKSMANEIADFAGIIDKTDILTGVFNDIQTGHSAQTIDANDNNYISIYDLKLNTSIDEKAKKITLKSTAS